MNFDGFLAFDSPIHYETTAARKCGRFLLYPGGDGRPCFVDLARPADFS